MHNHTHSYTHVGTATCMHTSMHTPCIAGTHMCSVPWSAMWGWGMAPCYERGEVQSSQNRGCVYGENPGSQGLEARECWGRKREQGLEHRRSRWGGGMPWPRHPQRGSHAIVHAVSQGVNFSLPLLSHTPSPPDSGGEWTEYLQKGTQIKLTPDFSPATMYARRRWNLI